MPAGAMNDTGRHVYAFTVTAGVMVTEMTPDQVQLHLQELVSAGAPPTIIFREPGVQGATIAGTHGPGTWAPRAAARAAMTAGLVAELHMPNPGMLMKGLLSMMLAAGWLPLMTRCRGRTVRGAGAMPKLHCRSDPFVTGLATIPLSKVAHDACVTDEIALLQTVNVYGMKTLPSGSRTIV